MARNMFGDMMRGAGVDSVADTEGQLVLVETLAGLTNYTHPPALRAPEPYMHSPMLEEMVLQNKSQGISPSQLKMYSAHMGGLNHAPSGTAEIRGGFSEYNKGMMKMKFRVQNGGIHEEYVHVLGYITGNDLEGELSENAWFTPVFSWKSQKSMSTGIGLDALSMIKEEVGIRTDYLINDGSYSQESGLASVRPGDVMSNAGDSLAFGDVQKEAGEEQVQMASGFNSTSTGAINQLGVVCSNRKNYNPTRYAEDLLGGAINAQQKVMFNGVDDGNRVTTMFHSEMNIISDITTDMLNRESRASHDDFLNYMKDLNGATTYRGFRGWQVRDVASMFPNFADTIPATGFVTMDSSRFEVIDFTEISQVFGTSSVAEVIAQEFVFNLLDVLVANGLGGIHIEGSNCDQVATEDRLSNIEMYPSTPASLGDNDVMAGPRMVQACDQLRNQIFNKLNGSSCYQMTPVRFRVEAEMFGITQIWLSTPNEEDREGLTVYMSFPTYAPSPWSPIFSDVETAHQLTNSIYGNVKSYFLEG